jgi:hypothetical protein
MIPGAIQLDSGTILVEDDSPEPTMVSNTSSDAISLFLKKTVEFSKSNSSVEDFAAYVISNFQLKLNGAVEAPKYSKNKPKKEEVQKHFQKFIPDQRDIEHIKAVKNFIENGKNAGDVVPSANSVAILNNDFNDLLDTGVTTPINIETYDLTDTDEIERLLFNRGIEISDDAITDMRTHTGVHMYGGNTTEGLVTRSVDLDTTPQQINYTGSTSQPFGSLSPTVTSMSFNGDISGTCEAFTVGDASHAYYGVPKSSFQPTQKELLSVPKVIETAETETVPRKRGRKPSKKR